MCGVLFTYSNKKELQERFLKNLDKASKTIEARGPDRTQNIIKDEAIIGHTHLTITGYKSQPIQTKDSIITYNGEIYNEYRKVIDNNLSDADVLEEYINEYGLKAFSLLDGEFAIIMYYPERRRLVLSTDVFGTKPLYLQIGRDAVVVGSYSSTVSNFDYDYKDSKIIRIPPNTLYEIDLESFEIVSKIYLHKFNFLNQTKNSYDEWIENFSESITKRTYNNIKNYFISFSSGHDSGLIAAEMIKQKKSFKAYSFTYQENLDILEERFDILKRNNIEFEIMNMSKKDKEAIRNFMKTNMDPYLLINEDTKIGEFKNKNMYDINGYIGSSFIHQKARKENKLISLSGQGADEIISDYYNEYSRSIKSTVRNEWEGIDTPWINFFGGWNRLFLGANERISGLHGIETRYPFLDVKLVQSYLNISPKYKNKKYKAPISKMLEQLNFPYHDRKQGFAAYEK